MSRLWTLEELAAAFARAHERDRRADGRSGACPCGPCEGARRGLSVERTLRAYLARHTRCRTGGGVCLLCASTMQALGDIVPTPAPRLTMVRAG